MIPGLRTHCLVMVLVYAKEGGKAYNTFRTVTTEFHSNVMVHMALLSSERWHPKTLEKYFGKNHKIPMLAMFHKGHLITTESIVNDEISHSELVRLVTVDRFREAHGELDQLFGEQKYPNPKENGQGPPDQQGEDDALRQRTLEL